MSANDTINLLLSDLEENVTSQLNDKAISCINSISSQVKINYIEANQPFNRYNNTEILALFVNIYKRIIPLTSVSKSRSINNSLNSFLNHWNGLISSLSPFVFIKLCEQLNTDGLTKRLHSFILPVTRAIATVDNNSVYNPMIIKMLKEVSMDFISTLPLDFWHTLVIILSVEQVEELIDYFISTDKNAKGTSILATKDTSKLYEKVFVDATIEFISKFILTIPKKIHFDVLTISSRITETMNIEGCNPEVAFDMIPFVVKFEPNEIERSAFYPFWPTIIEYLEKKQSVSALYALQAGYKVKMVEESKLIKFLKLDEKTDLRYRLASFQVSLEMIDCESIQSKLYPIIHEISMTRSNAMLCCLVDHLPTVFPSILKKDEEFAYDVVNTIMNPIPYDQFLPPFILRFLNSNSVPNIHDDHFTFNIEKIIYKYMNLTINVNNDIQKLMKKANIKIDMFKVDWFDLSLGNSVSLVEDISTDLLLEIISQETLHISYIPNIIEKLTQVCTRDDKNTTFYNKNSVDIRRIFDMTFSTFVKLIKLMGLDLNEELKKRNQEQIPIGQSLISDSYITGCVNFLIEPITPSYLGSLIRSMIKLMNSVIGTLNEIEKLPSNLILSFLIVADFLSIFMVDQTLLILRKIKNLVDDQDYFKKVESNAINNSALAYSKIVVEYLILEKGPEEAIKIEKNKSLKAASTDFYIAKKLAPYIDQPIPKFRTFLAFEGIEKHSEWVKDCKEFYTEDQWITAPNRQKEDKNQNQNKNQEENEDKSDNDNDNDDDDVDDENQSKVKIEEEDVSEKVGFQMPEDSKYVEKGIDGFLDGTKYSIVSFLNYRSNKSSLNSVNENVSIDEIEEFVMNNTSDIRLITGFFYYALCHEYHTPKYKEWLKLIPIESNDQSLYTISLFLTSLVGKNKSNLHLNLESGEDEVQMNDPISFKFTEFPEDLSKFILDALKSIGYYVISKDLIVFAFSHEISFRWFFIRSIISLDHEYFKDVSLISAEFTSKDKLATVYKPFLDTFHINGSFETLISIFESLTRIYFVPDKSMLVNRVTLPIVHDSLYSLRVSVSYPPQIQLENTIIDSLLLALSKQKYFPITFFTFFSQTKLTDKQFEIVRSLLSPKTKAASNFFNYLLPSAYFSGTFPTDNGSADRNNGGSEGSEMNLDSVDLSKSYLIDKETAIHFSNKPPSFSRAFYRSLMLPFTPILPQKLIVEIKDLLCDVFPPFSYATLNTWQNLNDFDQIIFQKYPEDLIENFKFVGRETIEKYRSVMNDSSFAKKNEISLQLILTAFSLISNVDFAIDVCDTFINFNVDLVELFKNKEVVNSEQFCCFCAAFSHIKRKLKLDNDFKANVKDLIEQEEKKDLFENMNQKETINQIVHGLFKDAKLPKFKWKKKLFFKP